MTLKQLREHLEAAPFRAFTLRTVSGKTVAVQHPEFVWIPPTSQGEFLAVEQSGVMHHLEASYIEAFEVTPKAAQKGGAQ